MLFNHCSKCLKVSAKYFVIAINKNGKTARAYFIFREFIMNLRLGRSKLGPIYRCTYLQSKLSWVRYYYYYHVVCCLYKIALCQGFGRLSAGVELG